MGRRILCVAALLWLLLAVSPLRAAETDFGTWLAGLKQEALNSGIRPATIELALTGVEPIERIIELDRKQPETTVSFEDYLARVVNQKRRDDARQRLRENKALLTEVGRRYGVQPRFIVALWGIETNFGQVTGGFPVISALATLAYDGRRSAFFRRELINALKIVDQYHIDPHDMTGSWAGAMGQSQFMPSTFLTYAVSYRGDSKRDIWHRRDDVFASIANYLAQSGWHADQTWGRLVKLPPGFDPALIGPGVKKPLSEWRKLGVRRSDGGLLPSRDLTASIVRPSGEEGLAVLAYDNFRTLLKWNSSSYFASAVGLLADSMESQ
ncbi:MAG TPA: lytic murein transglycosylase [Stellaceae bacterium]|nr:lytic murein transglycosylase [Stellaceae bacterium]